MARLSAGSNEDALLEVLRVEGPRSRAELGIRFGLSRGTIARRVERLLAAELVVEHAGSAARGRPPARLSWNPNAGVVLAIDLDRTTARLAVTNLIAEPLAETVIAIDVETGPVASIDALLGAADDLLDGTRRTVADLWGAGVGVASPVDPASRTLTRPVGMPGWTDAPIGDLLEARLGVPVVVDNDVRMMAIGEADARGSDSQVDFLFLKLGLGVGAAVVADGRPLRGACGGAGEISHVAVAGADGECRCGNRGCLETIAAGWAMLARLGVSTIDEIIALVELGDHAALRAMRDAGRALGELLAVLVNVLNPRAIVIGGELAAANEPLLAGVRELVWQGATPLAGGVVEITTSTLGPRAGITGAARAALDRVLTPAVGDAPGHRA